ncbi:MAG: alpha/beta fold hydrolase [Prolixibacteraceae bacterium]
MKLPVVAFFIGLLVAKMVFGQTEETILLITASGEIEGTLTLPETKMPVPVVLIIAGSGPTDRDGNNPMMTNNSLKMLSDELVKRGIATLRYDKRGIAHSKNAGLKEADLRFDMYVDDALGWIHLLKQNKNFIRIVVVGHSEGSLIGMIASQNTEVDRFVSISGAGQPADKIIREQLKAQPAFVLEQSAPILDTLLMGKTVVNVPQMLYSLFRPGVQRYMISWLKYDPQVEIVRLKKPVLILQGSTDIQVSPEDAKRLQSACPGSEMILLEGMNHVLKNAEPDRMKNIQTYNQPDLPVNTELVEAIGKFVLIN